MAVYFAIFQILTTFVYELFETMQSSVTRSRTSITKSLPASFKLSIFTLSSESYIKILCFMWMKTLFFFLSTKYDYRYIFNMRSIKYSYLQIWRLAKSATSYNHKNDNKDKD